MYANSWSVSIKSVIWIYDKNSIMWDIDWLCFAETTRQERFVSTTIKITNLTWGSSAKLQAMYTKIVQSLIVILM